MLSKRTTTVLFSVLVALVISTALITGALFGPRLIPAPANKLVVCFSGNFMMYRTISPSVTVDQNVTFIKEVDGRISRVTGACLVTDMPSSQPVN